MVIQPIDTTTPVILVTGGLGAGKSTWLNKALAGAARGSVAVVFTEEGATPIRNDLVEWSSERRQALSVGCACCATRSDLADTLRRLDLARVRGAMVNFRLVVIETSGAADPASVITGLFGDALVAARYRLAGIVAVGRSTEADELSAKRIAMADLVVLDGAAPDLGLFAIEGARMPPPPLEAPYTRAVGECDQPVDLDRAQAWFAETAARYGAEMPRARAWLATSDGGTVLLQSTQHLTHPPLRARDGVVTSRSEIVSRGLALPAGLPPP